MIIANSLTPSFGLYAQEPRGGICRHSTEDGATRTGDLSDGGIKGSGRRSLKDLLMPLITSGC